VLLEKMKRVSTIEAVASAEVVKEDDNCDAETSRTTTT